MNEKLKNLKIRGNEKMFFEVLLASLKHELGIKDEVSGIISKFIIENKDLLSLENKKEIVSNIRNQANYGYGRGNNRDTWVGLQKAIEEDIEKEETKIELDKISNPKLIKKEYPKENKKDIKEEENVVLENQISFEV